MIQQIIFSLVTISALIYAFRQFSRIRRNILLGKDEKINDKPGQRLNNVLLIAFGQKKMFKRWIPATFHFFIYFFHRFCSYTEFLPPNTHFPTGASQRTSCSKLKVYLKNIVYFFLFLPTEKDN